MKVSSELVATNTLWFVLFLTSLTTAQVHFLPQTLTWLFTSSQSLYNAPFPHFLPAGCGLLSQAVLLPSQRSGAEVPRRPSPSSCSHCLIGQIPSKGRYQLLTLQRVETLSCPDVPHSHRGVGIPGNQDVVSKLHATGQRLVARQRVDTPTWTRDTRLA